MAADPLSLIRAQGRVPRHVAVIMDGNGRWASGRGLPRHAGHWEGMKAVREAVEGACEAGVEILTLFAFSTENWKRPQSEIDALMQLLGAYAESEHEELAGHGVEVRVLGEVSRLDSAARAAVELMENATRGGAVLRLNLMVSYGGREEIVRAVRRLAEQVRRRRLDPEAIGEDTVERMLFTHGLPDPDLLVRTSGELRISNFLLWQLAYTEFHVAPVLWPDFRREDLFAAILDYQRRERRFGRVSTR
ncbi:MAG: di-trans,poly-cis-decaprenylcistransferase [Gemmatimonadetes bacterium]|nr:polyprenyl diphosphate synthase [Gemmatimonadota bacterium]MYA41690.1 di-trans,poly-cis-decaprenylcistransferase [Gemmatimonadota bacterium]MYE94956.1 di-trans,poly-cis-decaprenylcistransferase [Gemmatimonadota bacterium]MYJ11997.1 di-trans,poly-cis-decaprenylcistransferase [Gemmatimonadota bacterium]